MQEIITAKLKEIEETQNVRSLFCCEAGSRAWGFSSKSSDYDVRFIYIQNLDWYLSIDQKRDVIELPISDVLDMSGWELTKALRLFRKSNPALLEWLHSDIVYQKAYSTYNELKALESKIFSPVSSIHYYLQMAKRNFRECLQDQEIKVKKYFYVLRPVLACKWIEENLTIPPAKFQDLLNTTIENGPIKAEIIKLLKSKTSEDTLTSELSMKTIHTFLDTEITRISKQVRTINFKESNVTPDLDSLFRNTLREAWNV